MRYRLFLLTFFLSAGIFAQTNPRTLPQDTTPVDADLFPIWKASPIATKHVTVGTLKTILAPSTRTITCTAPLLCAGGSSMDLSADRVLSIAPFYLPLTGNTYTPTASGAPLKILTTSSTVTGATSEGLRTAMFSLFDTKTDSIDSVAMMMDCIQRTNAGAGTIKRSCLHVKSYMMPDNGGDVSGILSVATGGGPGLTVYKSSHLRPAGFTDYSTSPQPAIEVGSSDAGPALIASGGVTAWGASLRNHAIEARLGSATTDGILIWPTNNTFDDRLAFIIGSPQSNAAPVNITAQIQADGGTILKDLTLNHTSLNRITFLNSSATLRNATNDGSAFGFTFLKSRTVGGPVVANEILGDIGWNFVNSASGTVQGALIRANAVDPTATSEDVNISFYQNRAGTLTQGITFKSTGKIESVATVGGDSSTTLATKGYVDASAAGGGNKFTTIDTSSGTDPVADATTDTLTLTAGSGITITGDSTTDTVTIAATGGSSDPVTTVDIVDEFWSRSSTTSYGALEWGSSASSAGVHSEAAHPGAVAINTDASSGNVAALHLGPNNSWYNAAVADIDRVQWLIKTPADITSTEIRLGFMQNCTSTDGGSSFLKIEYDRSANVNWRLKSLTGGSSTDTDSTVAVAAATWYLMEIRKNASDYEIWINGVERAQHSTNIPGGVLEICMVIENETTSTRQLIIDMFRYKSGTLTRY